jgi:hypothetical protein
LSLYINLYTTQRSSGAVKAEAAEGFGKPESLTGYKQIFE